MRFANANLLWLLLLIPAVVVGMSLRFAWRRRMMAKLANTGQAAKLAGTISHGRRLAKAILLVVGLALLITTVARLQGGMKAELAVYKGIDIVVALDFSKSMLARDAYPSRIERAKHELDRLLDRLKGDRVGLVAFAGETLSYPLTTDYSAARIFWRDMMPNDMPVGGTAIGKALTAATRLLLGVRAKGPPRSQVILLLTDGEDTVSDPIAAAKEAAKLGIRIFAVGIGSASGDVVPELDDDGKIIGYQKKPSGKGVVTSRLDATQLRKIARLTKGKYIGMSPKEFGVEPIIAELSKLTRAEAQSRMVRHFKDIPQWLLFPAFMLLLIDAVLSDRKRRRALASAMEAKEASDAK
ncbi:MAG: VWA domain-containing protein [Myxococcales bacterium]|nr:VWA domain-containing protein [Myxococcales bacterium]